MDDAGLFFNNAQSIPRAVSKSHSLPVGKVRVVEHCFVRGRAAGVIRVRVSDRDDAAAVGIVVVHTDRKLDRVKPTRERELQRPRARAAAPEASVMPNAARGAAAAEARAAAGRSGPKFPTFGNPGN